MYRYFIAYLNHMYYCIHHYFISYSIFCELKIKIENTYNYRSHYSE